MVNLELQQITTGQPWPSGRELRECPQETPLHEACASGHANVAKLLLDHRANLEAKDMVRAPRRGGRASAQLGWCPAANSRAGIYVAIITPRASTPHHGK